MNKYIYRIIFVTFHIGILICIVVSLFRTEDYAINYLLTSSCLLAIANLFIIYITSKNFMEESDEQVMDGLKQQISLRQTYLSSIGQLEKSIQAYQQQCNIDLLDIYQCLTLENRYGLQHRVEKLKKLYLNLQPSDYCNNPIINAVLYPKCQYCLAYDIIFEVSLSKSDNLPINNMEFASILTNLIDNAIEAVNKLDKNSKRFIYLNGSHCSSYYFIRFENAKPLGNRIAVNFTSKKDKTRHGHGLQIIHNIIKRHDGSFKIQDNGTSVTFDIALRI